jgi:Ca2+-binding EF-hand superfamily protein
MTNALWHMLRVLRNRGLDIREYCLAKDPDATGIVAKKHLVYTLRNIGLPFSAKDLNDIVSRYAVAPTYDRIDYESFLRDAGVRNKRN